MQHLDKYFDLNRLNNLCKGDSGKRNKYLHQFSTLLGPKCEELETNIGTGKLDALRPIIHFMAPQLDFFGRAKYAQILKTLSSKASVNISDQLLIDIKEELQEIKRAMKHIDQYLSKQESY